MSIVMKQRRAVAALHEAGHLDTFEERILGGNLDQLLAELQHDHVVSDEIIHGVEGLRSLRLLCYAYAASLQGEERDRMAAFDQAWCAALIRLAQRERGDRHYRA